MKGLLRSKTPIPLLMIKDIPRLRHLTLTHTPGSKDLHLMQKNRNELEEIQFCTGNRKATKLLLYSQLSESLNTFYCQTYTPFLE